MTTNSRTSLFSRFLNIVEKGGNALPNPATLFALFAIAVLIFSWIGQLLGWQASHPATGEIIQVHNLLSNEGFRRIVLEMVENYTGFAPLGIVMVALLGIGIAESSGLVGAVIRLLVLKSPKKMLTFVLVFSGIVSNVASVSGGFSANLFIGTIDPLLAGLSTEAARILDAEYYVLPTANYYFMVVSTLLISLLGTWVTERIVEPRLGKYTGDVIPESMEKLNPRERKALRWVMVAAVAWVLLFAAGLLPDQGFLRGTDNTILHSPLIKGFIAFLFFMAASLGIVYGAVTGKFKNDSDVVKGMADSFKTLSAFLVLVFFAAQFVAYFKWSNLGLVIAVKGAAFLHQADLGLIPLIILFVMLSGFINLFMGSASAKWAIMGPVFIPMFMLLGYSPELSQAIFRVGDSVTNIISPMMSFFALIIIYFEKYQKNSGLGTLISTMLPYTIVFTVFWTILLIGWVMLDLPLGPEAPTLYIR
jgi:aminobenzoyl-glutamate transport protein